MGIHVESTTADIAMAMASPVVPTSRPLEPEPQPGDPNATLECDRVGFPCTLDSVQREILERSLALADSASGRFASGESGADILAWVRTRQDVVEAQGDTHAVRFRLADGRPVWVLDEQARASSAGRSATTSPAFELRANGGHGATDRTQAVVGENRDSKRALVLSPFGWEFEGFDESAAVAEVLGETRGYEGGVQFVRNATPESKTVTRAHFAGWDSYDVIHVSSHGKTICQDGDCRAMLTVARDDRPLEQVIADWPGPGVVFGKIGKDGFRYIALEADFFTEHYPTGIADAIVFLNACQTLPQGVTDLANAIRGSRGVFLGWTAPVQSGPGRDAALAFYTHLTETGATVGTSHASLGGLATNTWIDDNGNTVGALLSVTERAAGGDLRIREIVELEHPQGDGGLSDGAVVRMRGRPGDGQADTVPWRIRVDGVDSDAAGFIARVAVDGVAAQPTALSAGQSDGDMVWHLSGTVAMGRDLAEDEALEIVATVDLPDQGTSLAAATVTVTGDPGAWVGDFGYARVFGDDEFVITLGGTGLRFEYEADRNAYVVTGGTVFWTYEGATFNASGQTCTSNHGPVALTLPPGSAYIEIDHSTSPARYWGYGYFEGPEVEIPTSCPDRTLHANFEGPWFRADLSPHFLLDDGTRMFGEDVDDIGFMVEHWFWNLTLVQGS
jgi:hypothetical protein